ncbi:MAG: hypothetical protein IT256_04165, partial [Chitinophagaceae bacterium]|nr:hypothetical protein [Chitinophagaceae bacterium]
KYLSKQKVESAGLVEYKHVNNIVKAYLGGKTYYYNRVWALLVLHWWFYEKK